MAEALEFDSTTPNNGTSPTNATDITNLPSVSQKSHRRFRSVEHYVSELGGSKALVIKKVLIANNGVAAVKAIRSFRKWAYQVFGNDKLIQYVVMATPEDLRSNAEYIRMGDIIVDVPGGSNNHNYANVTLIVELARLHGVQAVWAGWGHASENPVLPDTLAKSNPPIKFIGPAGPPMRALGDKIGSTIIAQTAGVPCIGWNGQDVMASYNRDTGSLPDKAYDDASIHNAAQAEEQSAKIGFPVMIKASEGGGGKGIRRVDRTEDVATAYRQVCGEVPGSPIFIMKLSSNSRHLEVQLLADEYGNAVALNGRDCSVQRRHQKIIEEGPPVAANPKVWIEMENAAISLAKAVGYANAGTVEYLYSENDAKFYFLELNPRLQVEHPVTEMITKTNIPAAQLQVAMGIPLSNIPDVRELYGRDRFEEDPKSEESKIDFETAERLPPPGHCIAVRITAENAEAGFKPTSGGIGELNFRSTPNVWGYFSMDSSGSIHEFADSQFGHLFASGSDREHARRNMVLALKELSIRGDISTTVDYISKLIELEDFVANRINTGWLDEIIKENVEGMGTATKGLEQGKRNSVVEVEPTHSHINVVIGATVKAFDLCREGEDTFMSLLGMGQLPPRSLLNMTHNIELILSSVKYELRCTRNGPRSFSIFLAGEENKMVKSNVRVLSDGGYLIEIGGSSHVAYLTTKGDVATGMRLNIGGSNVAFSADYDPSSLRTDTAGKLVKKLVPDGSKVKKGEAYAEIEVMKMFMPLKVEEAGTISWCNNEGAALSTGDLLATLELDNPDNVADITIFEGDLKVDGWKDSSQSGSSGTRPHLIFRSSIEMLQGAMGGYALSSADIDHALEGLSFAVTNAELPALEISEQLSVLSGRIPAHLFHSLTTMLNDFLKECETQVGSGVQLRFNSKAVLDMIDKCGGLIQDESERSVFVALTTPLRDATIPYIKSTAAGVPGSDRALHSFLSILRSWIDVERWFCDDKLSYADSVENLRKTYKEDCQVMLDICRSHEQLANTSAIIMKIITAISDSYKVDSKTSTSTPIAKRVSIVSGAGSMPLVIPAISEIGSMGATDDYSEVALRARKLLMHQSMPSFEQRRSKVIDAVKMLASAKGSKSTKEAEDLLADQTPIDDVLFPLLNTVSSKGEEIGLIELYIRHFYRTYTMKGFERHQDERVLKFSFTNKQSESAISRSTSISSVNDLTRIVSISSAISDLSQMGNDGSDSESGILTPMQNKEKIPPLVQRSGVCAFIDKLDDLNGDEKYASLKKYFPSNVSIASEMEAIGPVNVLYFVILDIMAKQDDSSRNEIAKKCESILSSKVDWMQQADVRRVTFIFKQEHLDEFQEHSAPALFTFRFPEFKEDSVYRDIDPSHALHLDLNRVAGNFKIKNVGANHTSTCHTHLYEATPRRSAINKDKQANKAPRVFARTISFLHEFSSSNFEKVLVDSLNALDLCSSKSKVDNHLFINLISGFEKEILDPVVVEQVVVEILKRHGTHIASLGIVEVESRIVCSLSKDSPPIALRLVASNPTGFVNVMSTYVEAAVSAGGDRVFKLIGGTKASLASTGDSSWEGLNVDTHYPLTRPFDAQRKAALRATDSLYCYDLPALFEAAVEQQWKQASMEGGVEGGVRVASRPLMVMFTTELVVKKNISSTPDTWTIDDYLNGDLELVEEQRGAGANDVGMVAWIMTLKTVEYPNGRQIVLISNDITNKAGSFGTKEDVVFKMASEYAREKRIPRLYIAANSGARIGLAERVKQKFKVAFKDSSKPDNGFDFIYVTKEDYEELTKDVNEIIAVPVTYDGKEVYKITDIIGSEPDLGVENLKGSGLIAGETSVAYDEVFTMTIVLGRTVGIGAYLVRLGQRTIQKTTQSPIILTGYQALNKLMGVDVYSTNDQLGGPGIMYPNGISHLVEPDHLKAIKSAIDWLSYIPSVRGGLLPIADIRGVDELERQIEFTPSPGVSYDPRHLLAGGENDSGEWLSGFFDRGSFTETLAGWAKTVVVGRARLGGIPMGVVMTENRASEAIKPADPADLKASEAVKQEAGCVWFPNSAYKTAQAIKDFRTEDLPLMVFANWRGFSGGQRDMFDEVLKYGSLIVDAFVSYEQPVFVFIPPYAEVRGGAWVVLDASINASVMEMYAASGTARGGVLEANGAASVKYRVKDLKKTMHRLDDKLIELDAALKAASDTESSAKITKDISNREIILLPVYEQISVQFCEMHDTPGRMKAVGVINQEVEWKNSRSFFYWRLRRKLAEFDLRRQIVQASVVGQGAGKLTPIQASSKIKEWYVASPNVTEKMWDNDKLVLTWMGEKYAELGEKVLECSKQSVIAEVVQVMTAGGNTQVVATKGIIEGMTQVYKGMSPADQENLKNMITKAFNLN